MPLSAVVDSSVLVSAFHFPDSVPGRVLKLADQGRFALNLSTIIVEETRRSLLNGRLRSAYGHADGAVLAWCAALQEKAHVVTDPLPDVGRACRDPNDDHVIAAAVATKAEVIVTGDKDLLALGHYQLIRIITARTFVTEIADAA
jgi:uncharacterized protein